jgi:hypothetical protein
MPGHGPGDGPVMERIGPLAGFCDSHPSVSFGETGNL